MRNGLRNRGFADAALNTSRYAQIARLRVPEVRHFRFGENLAGIIAVDSDVSTIHLARVNYSCTHRHYQDEMLCSIQPLYMF